MTGMTEPVVDMAAELAEVLEVAAEVVRREAEQEVAAEAGVLEVAVAVAVLAVTVGLEAVSRVDVVGPEVPVSETDQDVLPFVLPRRRPLMKNAGGGPSTVPPVIPASGRVLRSSVEREGVPESSARREQWLPREGDAESSGGSSSEDTPEEDPLLTLARRQHTKRRRSGF